MITIKSSVETQIVIKKSRFIGFACRVSNESEAQQVLDDRRKLHRDARHHCFAYLLENGVMRYSDDGEPQGTAGLPMLEVIKRSCVSDVLVVCTRYFGGTLLGAPGLVRAYAQTTANTLETAPRIRLVPCIVYACTFDFAAWSRIQSPLTKAGFVIDDVEYTDMVRVRFLIRECDDGRFLEQVRTLTQGQSTPEPKNRRLMECDL